MSPLTPKQKKIAEFIQFFIDREGYAPSQPEIARHFGFKSMGTVQNYLVRLEAAGVVLRTWKGTRSLRLVHPKQNSTELPLSGIVAAGKPIEAVENPDTIEVPASMVGPGENFVLRVQGDSMVGDGIIDGDYVVVRKQPHAESGQTVVAMIRGEATVKRFYHKGQWIELHPANPALAPLVIEDEESFRIEGVVVGVIRHCL